MIEENAEEAALATNQVEQPSKSDNCRLDRYYWSLFPTSGPMGNLAMSPSVFLRYRHFGAACQLVSPERRTSSLEHQSLVLEQGSELL